jgi:hypothetical protein
MAESISRRYFSSMNAGKRFSQLCATGMCVACLGGFTGCVGYVDDGYGYGYAGPVIEPEVTFFGGYGRGHVVHEYSRRGHESRGAVHNFGHGGGRRR